MMPSEIYVSHFSFGSSISFSSLAYAQPMLTMSKLF